MSKLFKIKHLDYLKDIGDTPISETRRVKPTLLFCSSHLAKLNDKEKEYIFNKLNIKDVIDLRSDEEVSELVEKDDRYFAYHHLPLLTSKENPSVNKDTRNKILLDISSKPGGAKKHLEDIYSLMVDSRLSKDSFKKIFDILLTAKEGVLFHCTQGKDRTGVMLILLLLTLGVSEEIVIKEYLSFNKIHSLRMNFFCFATSLRFLSFNKGKNLKYLLSADKEFALSFINKIKKSYGSVENYLENGLYLSQSDIKKLKDKFTY